MKKRILTSIVILVIILPLIFLGGIPFCVGVSLLGIISVYEMIHLYENKKKLPFIIKAIT